SATRSGSIRTTSGAVSNACGAHTTRGRRRCVCVAPVGWLVRGMRSGSGAGAPSERRPRSWKRSDCSSCEVADIIVAMANEGAPFGPTGDPRHHLVLRELEWRLARLPAAPRDAGQIALVVRRHPDKTRELLDRVELGPGRGIPGDAWGRQAAREAEAELT